MPNASDGIHDRACLLSPPPLPRPRSPFTRISFPPACRGPCTSVVAASLVYVNRCALLHLFRGFVVLFSTRIGFGLPPRLRSSLFQVEKSFTRALVRPLSLNRQSRHFYSAGSASCDGHEVRHDPRSRCFWRSPIRHATSLTY